MSLIAKDETGEEIELSALTCAGCGSTMAGHTCPGGSFTVTRGAVNHVNAARAGVARGKKEDKPRCPHCMGVTHYNLGTGFEDMQCTWRQYLMAQSIITDPLERLPKMIPGEAMIDEYNAWVRATKPTFGTMVTPAAPTGGSYATLRSYEAPPKPPKEVTATDPMPKRGRKPKKGLDQVIAETIAATMNPEHVAQATGDDAARIQAATAVVEAPAAPRLTAAERRRAGLQARRKEKLLQQRAAVK